MTLPTRVFLSEDASYIRRVEAAEPMGFGDKPAIVVVDMSYAFVGPCGQRGQDCLRKSYELLTSGRSSHTPVFFTRISCGQPRVELRWKNSSEVRAIPELQEIVEEMQPRSNEQVIEKFGPSAFWETELHTELTRLGTDTLIVCGLVTSGCVRATVVDAFSHGFRVIVPAQCVSDPSQTSHEVCLVDMHSRYADVLGLDEVVHYLNRVGKAAQ